MTPCLHCSSGPSQLLIKRKQHCLLLASLLLSALFCSFSATSLLLLCSLCCFSAMSSRNVHVLSRNQVSERLVLVPRLRSTPLWSSNGKKRPWQLCACLCYRYHEAARTCCRFGRMLDNASVETMQIALK